MISCPLCAFRFEPASAVCSPACPLRQNCRFVCCPHCGYRMPDVEQAQSVKWIKRLWGRAAGSPESADDGK